MEITIEINGKSTKLEVEPNMEICVRGDEIVVRQPYQFFHQWIPPVTHPAPAYIPIYQPVTVTY